MNTIIKKILTCQLRLVYIFVVGLCILFMTTSNYGERDEVDYRNAFERNTIHTPPYVYHKDERVTLIGERFPISTCNDKVPSNFVDMEQADLSKFTFITGSSSNHFEESIDLIASIQHMFPDKRLYYYDLGLSGWQVRKLKSWCNVIYRKFELGDYPRHISHLFTSAFKPIIMFDALQDDEALLWLDASGRISKESNESMWKTVYNTARATGGIVQFDPTGRDTYQCTTEGMYRFLPGNEEKLKTYEMLGAGALLLYRTQKIYKEILHWWRLCALTRRCVEPEGHKLSCGDSNQPGISVCHRYDQSALNILVGNMLNYELTSHPEGPRPILIERYPTNHYEIQTCDKS